ncbi:MAG TPA: NADH-quinone oxidoreductase subunit H [Anaerovoracaceae bacterium]|nr:NADH-quinone oxidoreductase subunit H [Anaerovoracaceae bacterium]
MIALVNNFIQLLIILLLAPMVGGLIKKIKALTQKRQGAPVLQMYYDLYKLIQKESVVSETSSWIFKATPYIVFATAVVGALLVPITTLVPSARFTGDIILLFYLLALGRFFMCLSALDTGSTFGGMGSSREAMISSLIEPSILVSVFTIGLIAGSTSIYEMMGAMSSLGNPLFHPVFILTFLAMMIIILAETSRIPFDDPATHLELTMVHEAMLLEYSGRHLALMEYGAAVKQLILITLVVNLFLPMDQFIALTGAGGFILSVALYFVRVVFIAVLIAVAEVSTVKFRFFSIPNLAALSFILSFLGFLQYFVLGR